MPSSLGSKGGIKMPSAAGLKGGICLKEDEKSRVNEVMERVQTEPTSLQREV